MQMTIKKQEEITIYLNKKAQIRAQTQVYIQSKAKIRALLFNKALTFVLAKYFNYSNIFSIENIAKFLKHTRNNHVIKLKEGK